MKKILALFILVPALATGVALVLSPKKPSTEDIERGVASTWNVQNAEAANLGRDKFIVLVTWKEMTKANSAAGQLCDVFPLESVHWNNKLGEPRSFRCK